MDCNSKLGRYTAVYSQLWWTSEQRWYWLDVAGLKPESPCSRLGCEFGRTTLKRIRFDGPHFWISLVHTARIEVPQDAFPRGGFDSTGWAHRNTSYDRMWNPEIKKTHFTPNMTHSKCLIPNYSSHLTDPEPKGKCTWRYPSSEPLSWFRTPQTVWVYGRNIKIVTPKKMEK